jgi:hypothetical protein
MLSLDQVWQCYTLEPPPGKMLVPLGTYEAALEVSPKLSALEGTKIVTPRLFGVPGWPNNDVLIHFGNMPSQTEGCTIVGATRGEDWVGNSRLAFDNLIAKLPERFTVSYTEETST